jgi:PadR family transcriptional regulator PadR
MIESYRHPIAISGVSDMGIKQRDRKIDVLQGTLDLLILQTLQWGPQHGLGIGQAIRAKSKELLQVEAGSLYPALHRLELDGLLRAQWKTSEKGQRAKYYQLTAAGKRQLSAEHSKWKQLLKAIRLVLRPAEK